MQEHEVRELIDRILGAMDPALEYEVRHEDFTVDFPQSGERLDRDGLRKLQEHFPGGPPEIRLRRLTGHGDLWVTEAVIRYADGKLYHSTVVIEFRDGKIWRETRYYAEPFEAPAWRAQWVQRIEEPAAG
jgi:SnoaL-like domain